MNAVPGILLPWPRQHIIKLNACRFSRRSSSRRSRLVFAAAGNGESLYQVLGIAPGAGDKDIKRAYRRLALKFHPDVNKEPDAQEKFMRIKQAYQTLVDPSKRAKYEASKRASDRRQSWKQKEEEEEDFYGLEEFFRDLKAEFRKREATSSQSPPKSLWEELAELGEEFLEFLEKELIVDAQSNDNGPSSSPSSSSSSSSQTKGTNSTAAAAAKEMESQVDEIEELLTKLKNELGLQ